MPKTAITLIVLAGATAGSRAQSTIDPANKYAWQENCGWLNWRDANGAAQGVRDRATYLSGFIWGENIGWINVGSAPVNGTSYANTSGSDAGVNVAASGALSGFAWGENVGWINFSGGASANPPQPARFDFVAERFRGYVWGENIGWVNLDDSTHFVKRTCYANCDGSTNVPILNVNDFVCFQNRYASGDPSANCDRSTTAPVLNVNDFICFQNHFASGCP